ncbi:inositol monophosphatase family protein [Campylobacter estrildidarum]|uniref:Inositol monophosphatase n=1 Tax=Campylobacter estrildidarum TaxID=2510189 RepID=A0A4U7BLH4_9BACT|nr:inositol monophosphatase family protein [Campylobacter estrildidarum]TKX31065.1 inositol monophosphatase [Campylobacter estrildidarum]
MKNFLDACLNANLEIDRYLKNIPQNDFNLYSKNGYNDNKGYEFDLKCEQIFVKHLSSFGQIFSEESGLIGENNSCKIILDPLDGSSNFISKIPFYGTSVALIKDNEPQSAFICNLASNEILAFDENKALKANLSNPIYSPILPNQFSQVGIIEKITLCPNILDFLSKNKLKFRSLGATALSLAYAYYFNFVLILGKTRTFDTAGASMLCKNLYLEKNEKFFLVSKDKKIFDIILKFLDSIWII